MLLVFVKGHWNLFTRNGALMIFCEFLSIIPQSWGELEVLMGCVSKGALGFLYICVSVYV